MRDLGAYWIELAATAFIVAAAGFYSVALHLPASPLYSAIPNPAAQRLVIGLLVGATAASIVYSPWGRRSGAHLNPALTLTFFRLHKVAPIDVWGYVAAQFGGAFLGIGVLIVVVRPVLDDPAIRWFVTVPGACGVGAAFAGEAAVTAILMVVILSSMSSERWRPYTGLFAAGTVALAIALESPLSGAALNPARSTASAAFSGIWTAEWVYLVAPLLGMLVGAELFVRFGSARVPCAKLAHDRGRPCQFLDCALTPRTRRTPADEHGQSLPDS